MRAVGEGAQGEAPEELAVRAAASCMMPALLWLMLILPEEKWRQWCCVGLQQQRKVMWLVQGMGGRV
eukprot:scaffold197422_cov12-Tisochrysis_lutea.AAC.1